MSFNGKLLLNIVLMVFFSMDNCFVFDFSKRAKRSDKIVPNKPKQMIEPKRHSTL